MNTTQNLAEAVDNAVAGYRALSHNTDEPASFVPDASVGGIADNEFN